ncbi:MAG: hypothetical protein ACYTG4_08750 [Planctomycetota bacterium]
MMIKPGSRGAGAAVVLAVAALLTPTAPLNAQDGGAGGGAMAGPSAGTVTFDVRDQPIDSVLSYVRRAAGSVNIVVAPEAMSERVTLSLTNANWREALDEIAKRTNCTVERVSATFLRVEKPPRVSFSFEQADIAKVIRTIAALSGANIVSDPDDVVGMVTVNLINVPWRKALQAIVGTKGYKVVEEDGGILRVVSHGRLTEELETAIVQLRYLRPPPSYVPTAVSSPYVQKTGGGGGGGEDAFTILRSLREALQPEGSLEYISDSNALVLKGTKTKLAAVREMLATLDTAPHQIFVDMQFITTRNQDFLDLGMGPGGSGLGGSISFAKVDGGVHLPFNTGKGGFEDSLLIKDGLPKVGNVDPTFAFGSLDFSTSSYVLKLLKQDVRSRVVQAPKLFVLDNQEATIFVGETVRYADTEASSSQSGTLQFSISEAGSVSTGFQLLMVPHVIPETNRVMITLVPNQTQLTGTSSEQPGFDKFSVGSGASGQTIFLPRESTSTLVTTLLVDHGQTAVLGGLMQDNTAESVDKVPFLGDLPLLGWLFKTESRSKQRQQLMIFMTPWLIGDSTTQRDVIRNELERREPDLDAEWELLLKDAEMLPDVLDTGLSDKVKEEKAEKKAAKTEKNTEMPAEKKRPSGPK